MKHMHRKEEDAARRLEAPSSAVPRGRRDAIETPRADAAFGPNRPNANNVNDSKSLERLLREKPDSAFLQCALDHAAFRRNRLNADDVIDSKSLERALREKPDSAFLQRALERERVVE